MVNSIQLKGLTYVSCLPETAKTESTDGEDFKSVLDEEINAAENTEENNSVKYTDPEDLVSVDSPGSLETYFQEAASTYGVPIALIKAVAKAESNFNSQAVSGAGAQGIMQLMPGTAQGLGVEDSFNARENILGGTKYLAKMLTRYNGSVKLALAAYNAGAGNVDKYDGVPPFTETQNYIKKIFGYLGLDSEKKTEETEDTTKEDTVQNAQSSNLSDSDIKKLADAIISGISTTGSTSTASDLYSQLYNSSSTGSTLNGYSSVLSQLLNK